MCVIVRFWSSGREAASPVEARTEAVTSQNLLGERARRALTDKSDQNRGTGSGWGSGTPARQARGHAHLALGSRHVDDVEVVQLLHLQETGNEVTPGGPGRRRPRVPPPLTVRPARSRKPPMA